jgi:hypothetical protein
MTQEAIEKNHSTTTEAVDVAKSVFLLRACRS